jgi:plasmid stabilization system protein ParE
MSFYALTPLAKADIFEIWSHIAQESENAADRVEAAIYDASAFVADSPSRGHYGLISPSVRFVSGR